MSIQGVAVVSKISKSKLNNAYIFVRNFSRRSAASDGPYKVVKPRESHKDTNSLAWRDPSFELLAPTSDFPFFLPGNVGLAWYDTQTTAQMGHEFIMEQTEKSNPIGNIVCRVQTCPKVLRQTVSDLFPYRNLENCELSVITISLKPDLKSLRKNKEIETEKLAQTFVLTAKSICDKLRKAGYWADFINPFSGRPYLCPASNTVLYETDEKFRCMDFQIYEIKNCKIVSNEQDKSRHGFIGSMFTTAPSKKSHLDEIFQI